MKIEMKIEIKNQGNPEIKKIIVQTISWLLNEIKTKFRQW